MSVVILGGNERMERQYKDLGKEYNCKAKGYTKQASGFRNKLGSPDLMIFFTSCMSHKMVHSALGGMKGCDTVIERCQSASMCALREVLEKHCNSEICAS